MAVAVPWRQVRGGRVRRARAVHRRARGPHVGGSGTRARGEGGGGEGAAPEQRVKLNFKPTSAILESSHVTPKFRVPLRVSKAMLIRVNSICRFSFFFLLFSFFFSVCAREDVAAVAC